MLMEIMNIIRIDNTKSVIDVSYPKCWGGRWKVAIALRSTCSIKIFALTGEMHEPISKSNTWRYRIFLKEKTVNLEHNLTASITQSESSRDNNSKIS